MWRSLGRLNNQLADVGLSRRLRRAPTALDLLLRLGEALRVSLGEMCDFESVEEMDQKTVRRVIGEMLKKRDAEQLKLTLKVLKSLG